MGCPDCGGESIVVRYVNSDGSYTYPPVVNNTVTIPNPEGETDWAGTGQNGVVVIQGGANGHTPTIEACLSVNPDNALTIQNGCLFVASSSASPDWSSANTVTVGGILVQLAGPQGHTPSFQIVGSPDSPAAISFDAQGRLVVDCCPDLPLQISPGENIVITTGDNPGGVGGNGHRPTVAVRDGAALCPPLEFRCTTSATGVVTVEVVNPQTGGSFTLGSA